MSISLNVNRQAFSWLCLSLVLAVCFISTTSAARKPIFGKRVYDGGYQETLPEVLEDFVPGIKPDDGMCRMEEAFQLLSTNWQDIITLVFKLGLADVGSERK
ncbi:uncharacterized protein [Antedon mediterranea]|uniref:uncharacterized protein isoform X3 n=1 Tax=Antedon mediterranea TaxID=105859 RepID=UPI003AF77183